MVTETNDVVETTPRSDLRWDDEARGLCIRLFPDNSQSFIFVFRIKDHQRFIRIGRSPRWSLKAARIRATELRSIIDKGRDPVGENRESSDIAPVEGLIQYIAERVR
jgi:Arm DNA-binding domain